jgi:delta 1-pyrroline-5-carboxylate dehydrogenase
MNSSFPSSSSGAPNGFAMVLPSISPSGQPLLVTSGIGPSGTGNSSHLRLAAQHKNLFRNRQQQQQLQQQIQQLQQQQQQRKQKSQQQQLQRQLSNSASLLLMQNQLNAAAAASSNLLRSFNSSSTAAMLSNSNEVLQLNRQLLEFLTQIKHTFALLENKIRGRQHLIDSDLKEAYVHL